MDDEGYEEPVGENTAEIEIKRSRFIARVAHAATEDRARAIVEATTHFDDPDTIARVSRGLGEAMVGITVSELPAPHRLAERGW